MPISIDWDDEQRTILRITFAQPWDWNDFYPAGRQMELMRSSAAYPVIRIVDFSESQTLPSGALAHFRRERRASTGLYAATVVVGAGPYVRFLLSTVSRIVPGSERSMYFASTLDEARRTIERLQGVVVPI